jgi:hypothetical protein
MSDETNDPIKRKDPESWRYVNLKPEYRMGPKWEHGIGFFPIHKETGEVCDCKMEWNEDGTILSCPVCGLDGT